MLLYPRLGVVLVSLVMAQGDLGDGSRWQADKAGENWPREEVGRAGRNSLHVVSRGLRRDRRSADPEWRNPREYQFVTRGGLRDSSRLGRYYDDPRSHEFPRSGGGNKRIIYYATLPEVTRRPEFERPYQDYRGYRGDYRGDYRDYRGDYRDYRGDYRDYRGDYRDYRGDYRDNRDYYRDPGYPPRYDPQRQPYRPSYPGYPPTRDNEIVTRVQSSVIDVTSKDKHREPGLTKFTIIDAEPPYLRDYKPFDHRVPPPRKETTIPIPPAPVTVYRKPLDVRPLDVRPIKDLSTTPSPSTTSTTLNPIQKFERNFKF